MLLMGLVCGAAPAAAQSPGFVSSLLGKPADWQGSAENLFAANYEFPDTPGDVSAEAWLRLDPRKAEDRAAYYEAVLAYGLKIYAGDIRSGCTKTTSGWYHVPWMTISLGTSPLDIANGVIGSGREPICGLTEERAAPVGFLHAKQTRRVQSWAVGAYNQPGGFLMGRIWRDRSKADLSETQFPNGTFVMKFLFSEAETREVPYLAGAPEWQVNIYERADDQRDPPPRQTKTMRLAQLDFSIRDSRMAETGWVYGTFIYYNDETAPVADWTKKLLPVGVMWGNDPGKTDSAQFTEQALDDKTVALREAGKLFDLGKRQLFGFTDRVNGPLDNPISSCLSCHGTAQVHPQFNIKHFITPSLVDTPSTTENHRLMWFRNIPAGGTFTFTDAELSQVFQGRPSPIRKDWTPELMAQFVSVDTSLQLRMAIETQRAFGIQMAFDTLETFSTQSNDSIIAAGTRQRMINDFKLESRRIERDGEPEPQ